MYDKLVMWLRCEECLPYNALRTMREAADAIEELQKTVMRLEEASGILDELPMVDQRKPPKEE